MEILSIVSQLLVAILAFIGLGCLMCCGVFAYVYYVNSNDDEYIEEEYLNLWDTKK